VKKTNGLITIKIKIFEIEEKIDVHIVENEHCDDFLIGLDTIKKFKLIQKEDLRIEQKRNKDIKKPNNTIEENCIDKEKNKKTKEYSINFNEHIQKDEFEIKIEHLDTQKKKK